MNLLAVLFPIMSGLLFWCLATKLRCWPFYDTTNPNSIIRTKSKTPKHKPTKTRTKRRNTKTSDLPNNDIAAQHTAIVSAITWE